MGARQLALWICLLGLLGSLGFLRVGGTPIAVDDGRPRAEDPKVTHGPESPMDHGVDLLFLHHSVGAQLLSDPGPDDLGHGTHPNGGGLGRALAASGYRVHEATYGSRLGEHTDLFDWVPKFEDHMDEILRIAHQDSVLDSNASNRVVLFKSCFPNSWFEGPGVEPGNPRGPALTEANARASFRALLPAFQKHPDVLFVYLTAPPLAPYVPGERLYTWVAKKMLGRPVAAEKLRIAGETARRFNAWIVDKDGWLAGYAGTNVVAFDYFSVLTDGSATGLSRYPSGGGKDSHPASEGNRRATELLIPFLNDAVRRAGIRSGV